MSSWRCRDPKAIGRVYDSEKEVVHEALGVWVAIATGTVSIVYLIYSYGEIKI